MRREGRSISPRIEHETRTPRAIPSPFHLSLIQFPPSPLSSRRLLAQSVPSFLACPSSSTFPTPSPSLLILAASYSLHTRQTSSPTSSMHFPFGIASFRSSHTHPASTHLRRSRASLIRNPETASRPPAPRPGSTVRLHPAGRLPPRLIRKAAGGPSRTVPPAHVEGRVRAGQRAVGTTGTSLLLPSLICDRRGEGGAGGDRIGE